MKKKTIITGLILLSLIVTGILGCEAATQTTPAATTTTSAPSSGPVKIGLIAPLSGPVASAGAMMLEGFKVAVKGFNDKGGILGGRKIEFSTYDTTLSPEEAVKVATKAIVNDKVDALVGLWEASEGLAVADLVKSKPQYQIPLVQAVPGDMSMLTNGYPSLIMTGTHTYGEVTPWFYLLEKQGAKSVVIVYEDVQYNHTLDKYIQDRWGGPNSKVKILDTIWHPVAKGELMQEFTKAVAAKPDAIIGSQFTPPAFSAALKALYDLKYPGMRVFGGPFTEAAVQPGFDWTLGEGCYAASGFIEDPSIPANKDFCALFRANVTGPLQNALSNVAAYTYNGTTILLASMDKAGTTSDKAKIWAAMQSLDWTTAMGDKVKFTSSGRLLYTKGFICKAQGGKLVITDHYPIAPEDYNK